MINQLNIILNYIFNISIFRRKYFVYKHIDKGLYYLKTTRLLTRAYFIPTKVFITNHKLRKQDKINEAGIFLTQEDAIKRIVAHRKQK